MSNPKISVIVPVYKAERYLSACIDSILAQTFTDFELLLIDDGSPDASGQICDEYVGRDSRIRVFHKENGGVSSARNLGLDKAAGEWVTFVDSDDIIESSFFADLVAPLAKNPELDFIQAGCKNVANGQITSIEQEYENLVGDDASYLLRSFRGLTVSKLFRLENVRQSHGLRFDEQMKIAEDMAFTLDYLPRVRNYAFVSSTGYLYRRDNEGSATHRKVPEQYDVALHRFRHIHHSLYVFLKNRMVKNESANFRKRQIGHILQNVLFLLYRNNFSRVERLTHLKNDFTKEQITLLKYTRSFGLKYFLSFLLLYIGPHCFDGVTNFVFAITRKKKRI